MTTIGDITSTAVNVPRLEGDARAAVDFRGGHLQIIASAGSGKTEVVSQRVSALLAEGVKPDGVVAARPSHRGPAMIPTRLTGAGHLALTVC